MFAKLSLAAIKSVPKLSPGTMEITFLYDCHIRISHPPENQSDLDLTLVGSSLGHEP